MNTWGLVDQESMVALRNSATINKFKQSYGFEHSDRLVLSNRHSSQPDISKDLPLHAEWIKNQAILINQKDYCYQKIS